MTAFEDGEPNVRTLEANSDEFECAPTVIVARKVSLGDRLASTPRFVRYTGVNICSVSVDTSIFLALTHLFALPILASIVAYGSGIVLNYRLSKRYVFAQDIGNKSERRLFTEFLGTGIFGLALTAVVTAITTYEFGFSPPHAKIAAVLTCFLVLYFIRCALVFRAKA